MNQETRPSNDSQVIQLQIYLSGSQTLANPQDPQIPEVLEVPETQENPVSIDHAGISVTSVPFACIRTRDTTAIPRLSKKLLDHRPRVPNTNQQTPTTAIPRCTLGTEIHHRTRSGPTTVPIHSIHRSTEPTEIPRKPSFNHAPDITIPSSQRATSNRLRLRAFHTLKPSIPQTPR